MARRHYPPCFNDYGRFGKRIALVIVMYHGLSSLRLRTDVNRVAQAALFVAFYEGRPLPRSPVSRTVFKLSFDARNGFY
jgi:hypothetical protein